MLALFPMPIRVAVLAVIGALAGAFINWAIYALPYFRKRSISPWMRSAEGVSPRPWSDYLPVFGWFGLRRESKVHGAGFWVRPLLIELVWLIGVPWFYLWQLDGGLTGEAPIPAPANWASIAETWFWTQSLLIGLMFVATFIDFDERTIPDSITLPGTLVALMLAVVLPAMRLPDRTFFNMSGLWGMDPLHFASPRPIPNWHQQPEGIALALGISAAWMLALLPKICTLRYGLVRGVKIMIASVLRPPRKTHCEIRTAQRGPFGITWCLAGLTIMLVLGIAAAWKWCSAEHWTSLFSSIVGLGFGGAMVWSIRLVARWVMGREAMGFGDVTLMAMIGAFLGWQPALLTFAIAPFAAMLIVVVSFLVTKENELAFGPYLCFGCLVLLLGWSRIWPAAVQQFFFLGPWLLVILMVALILMAGLLAIIQWIKGPQVDGSVTDTID